MSMALNNTHTHARTHACTHTHISIPLNTAHPRSILHTPNIAHAQYRTQYTCYICPNKCNRVIQCITSILGVIKENVGMLRRNQTQITKLMILLVYPGEGRQTSCINEYCIPSNHFGSCIEWASDVYRDISRQQMKSVGSFSMHRINSAPWTRFQLGCLKSVSRISFHSWLICLTEPFPQWARRHEH